MREDCHYALVVVWDAAEDERWLALRRKRKQPSGTWSAPGAALATAGLIQAYLGAAEYTEEEKAWLEKHYGGEYKFLLVHGLRHYDDEDRGEGRATDRSGVYIERSMGLVNSTNSPSSISKPCPPQGHHVRQRRGVQGVGAARPRTEEAESSGWYCVCWPVVIPLYVAAPSRSQAAACNRHACVTPRAVLLQYYTESVPHRATGPPATDVMAIISVGLSRYAVCF